MTETFKAGSKTSSAAPEGVVEYANEILITKSELEEKNKLVHNLQQQVDETKTESEYQLRYVLLQTWKLLPYCFGRFGNVIYYYLFSFRLKDNRFAEESKAASKKFENDLSKMSQTINRLQVGSITL